MSTSSNPPLGAPVRRNTSQLESATDQVAPTVEKKQVHHDTPELGEGQDQLAAERTGTSQSFQPGILRRMTTGLLSPERKLVNVPSYSSSFRHAFLSSYLNILLIFIPISWGAHFGGLSDTLIFVFSFLAIIPLAALLSFATEELALRVGQTLGGLLNATLGNAVELIVAILALIKCELQIVQSSLVGSILSNMLLVLGMCFFAGGTKYAEQEVMSMASQLNSSLLFTSVLSLLIPAAFHLAVSAPFDAEAGQLLERPLENSDILAVSRGVAVILVFIYISYLVFQLYSHAHLYVDPTGPTTSTQYPDNVKERVRGAARFGRKPSVAPSAETSEKESFGLKLRRKMHMQGGTAPGKSGDIVAASATRGDERVGSDGLVHTMTENSSDEGTEEEGEAEEEPQLNMPVTIMLLVGTTVIVGVTAEWLVSSIDGLTEANPALSHEWVGLILLPIVGNAAEHVTAVTVARKDKLDLSMQVAIGSSIQIALFVIPLLVLLAWWIGKPLTLLFDPFESIVLFLGVLLVNSTLADSRSNWLEGVLLMSVYLIVAVAFWYYPGQNPVIAC